MIELLEDALQMWGECPAGIPAFGRCFSASDQSDREARFDRFLACLKQEMGKPPRNRAERRGAHARITAAFAAFGREALGLEETHLELLLGGGLPDVATELARAARRFDASVQTADILQAARNAWTACSLQTLFGGSAALTPAIFSYSMLYPYTDNYLDDPSTSGEAKRSFSIRFGRRLAGEPVTAANSREETIWRLVGLIETQYPRPAHPQVFESLLLIHRAQAESVRLVSRGEPLEPADVATISFAKGGASVLADGYLAKGSLGSEEQKFAYCWGVLLQLGDDLQDIRKDVEAGQLTMFSQAAGRESLDGITSRTLHFAQRVMLLMRRLPGPVSPALQQLIQRSSVSLVIRSAGAAREFYTPGYIQVLEAQSPFRFAFLKQRRRELGKRSGLLVRLFEAFLEGDPDEPVFPWLPSSLMPRA